MAIEAQRMPGRLEDHHWNLLLERIDRGACTPFVGAGACSGSIPLGAKLARQWARSYDFPLPESSDLVRVAQFLAVRNDDMFPKDEIVKIINKAKPPIFTEPDEPHGVLARLPLPVYITTNYDSFLRDALVTVEKKPRQEICRWNDAVKKDVLSHFETEPFFDPDPINPVVFHLHGHISKPQSLVLTEDDYFDSLVQISRDPDLLPKRIERALRGASLLFIGYRLADWDFRVLFRTLIGSLKDNVRYSHFSVQVEGSKEARSYFDRYFAKLKVHVYWGTAREFTKELGERWEAFRVAKGRPKP